MGGRKARSAAPPAAASGGGREASLGPEAGRSASPGAALLGPRCRRGAEAGSGTRRPFRRNSPDADARAGCRRCSSQPTPPRGDPRPLRRVGALRWQRRGHSPEACLTRGCEMPTVPRISAQSRTGAAHAPVLHVGRYPALTRPRRESRAYGAPKPR